ncbi:PA14 domain-containing protein [Neobacillus mesonae]|nr:PA14 domain-containing protein [Neobacillus mesonae]
MKQRFGQMSRMLAAILICISLITTGVVPIQPAWAEAESGIKQEALQHAGTENVSSDTDPVTSPEAVEDPELNLPVNENEGSGDNSGEEQKENIPVTGISLDKDILELAVGESEQLNASIVPAEATNPAYAWSSDNTEIAIVGENGLVTAVGNGTTGITVTTEEGGYKASAIVNVTEPGLDPAAVPLAGDFTLVEKNSAWRYLDTGTDQGTVWNAVYFDDSSWSEAPAPLGYAASGKGQDLNTWINYGGDSGNKHITTYFRQEFTLTDKDAITMLEGSLIRDDGAVVYLNGQEVYRVNLPDGNINYKTTALTAVGDERNEDRFSIDPTLLHEGTNVIAAEVHQDRGASSDVFFSLELHASTTPLPGKNQGLLGEYYLGEADFSFGEHTATTVDQQINFTNLDPVLQAMTGRQDEANVRWTGQIMSPEDGEYTFYMIGDNGFRLWVNDELIIDHWINDWDKEQTSSPIFLQGGQKYDIKIEYFEDYGGSNLYLRWSSPTLTKEIVPARAFYLHENYNGPISGSLAANGKDISLELMEHWSGQLETLAAHFNVRAGKTNIPVEKVELSSEGSVLNLRTSVAIMPEQLVNVTYDGQGGLTLVENLPIGPFAFSPLNRSEVIDYSPIAIAMTFNGSPQTTRGFAWYTNHEKSENAPDNAADSIVEIVPAGQSFDSEMMMRFEGNPEDTEILNLRYTNSTNRAYISHKVLADGLTPGTAYDYRLGADNNWSQVGTFTTESDQEDEFEFLYLTDSQGANNNDYKVWSNTLNQALEDYPDSKFLIMPGDMVDAGALEYQWLDYFGEAQDMLMNLPILAAIGNHEGPYNNNFTYHFNYPNDAIENPLPKGSVYSFDYGDAHFMVMNTMDMGWDNRQRESFNQQIEWLRSEVAQTDKKWKIVAIHKAVYSVGGHSDEAEIYELRDMLIPVFDELGIDVVLQGHDHTFMRSKQMYDFKPIEDEELVKDANGNPLNPDGTMYIVNNAAGTKYYGVNANIDKSYGAVYEQPNKPIYSGIKMTEESLTIESYRSGEEAPFDTYTIVRDDEKPNPVERLSAGQTGDGQTVLTWSKPEDKNEKDTVRGFRIYEANGKLGKNWSAYVPVISGKEVYQYVVEEADPGLAFEFLVSAVDLRDNSDSRAVMTEGNNVPAAPTSPVVDDGRNTFGWTEVPGYNNLSDYEFSVDGGESWEPVIANPQPIGDADYEAGAVQVRIKADAASDRPEGHPLLSDKPFTVNSIHDAYLLSGEVSSEGQLKVEVTAQKHADYSGDAYIVFQLMKGRTPLLINALPLREEDLEVAQYFNVSGTDYSVKVFVFDRFDSDPNVPVHLARPIELRQTAESGDEIQ